ncbi:type VI secretion system baseplate subunit TssG [Anatilimnocola floriformis]|uniref:type VI secretion system baseplate subunit TssG n=1 Tax=Anatilimnocola floriformis TaxID=2948575 RepID=UPI0020C53526|nr:type VI secretion system baseplate subunit TssG [Anatilimnocola floriformis]
MAAENWPSDAELADWIRASKAGSDIDPTDADHDPARPGYSVRMSLLGEAIYRYEFFAAMHALRQMRLFDHKVDLDSLLEPLPIRFRAHQSLSFPSSEVFDLRSFPNQSKRRLEMTVSFLGLTGSMGALPRFYTEKVIERMQKRDFVLRDFLDLFNHRLVMLFHEAGQKYRFWFDYERAVKIGRIRQEQGTQKFRGFVLEDRPKLDKVSQNLLDLGGFGTSLLRYKDIVRGALANRLNVADETLRHYAGLLSQSHRSAIGLEQLLSGYFATQVKVQQFVGQWLQLPAEYRTCLPIREEVVRPGETKKQSPAKPAVKTAAPRLGQNTVIGSRIWESQGKFRIRLGPLSYKQFLDYLPVGGAFLKLAQLTRVYVRGGFDYDVQPTLKAAEVPWCQLGGKESPGARLGWNTWVRNKPFEQPADDAVFNVENKLSFGS